MNAKLALPIVLLGLSTFLIAAPAYAIPACTGTATEGSNTYTLTLTPCSGTGVALNTLVTATGTTTDSSIVQVNFTITNPSHVSTHASATGPFTTSFTGNQPGTWTVSALFCNAVGACTDSDVISFSVQILVLDVVPLGVVSVLGISLLGLVAFTRLGKRPLPK